MASAVYYVSRLCMVLENEKFIRFIADERMSPKIKDTRYYNKIIYNFYLLLSEKLIIDLKYQ